MHGCIVSYSYGNMFLPIDSKMPKIAKWLKLFCILGLGKYTIWYPNSWYFRGSLKIVTFNPYFLKIWWCQASALSALRAMRLWFYVCNSIPKFSIILTYWKINLHQCSFPHIVIDNFFDSSFAEKLVRSFPDLRSLDSSWRKNAAYAIKYASVGETNLPADFIDLVRYLNSQPFIEFLQAISSIQQPLLPDPSLEGGGLHQTFSGGFLKMHTDFNRHPKTDLSNESIFYITWTKNGIWLGGSLVLSSKNPGFSPIKIEPLFNRAVIFSTDFSYHGHRAIVLPQQRK